MLDVTCDECGRVLIGPRRITSVVATGAGLRVAYVCWCGLRGVEITGRRRPWRHVAPDPAREPAAA